MGDYSQKNDLIEFINFKLDLLEKKRLDCEYPNDRFQCGYRNALKDVLELI